MLYKQSRDKMHYVWLHLQNSTIDQTTDRKASKGISCVKRGGKVRVESITTCCKASGAGLSVNTKANDCASTCRNISPRDYGRIRPGPRTQRGRPNSSNWCA